MTKHSQTLLRIRYLCDARLRSEIVIPLLMAELKHVVRFTAWSFVWSSAVAECVNSALSPMRPQTLRYFAEHFGNVTRDLGYSVEDAIRTFPAVSNPRRTGRINPRMDETESYREVWGPEGLFFNLAVIVRSADGRPLGMVQLFRPKDDVDFDLQDEGALQAVLAYLRRLLLREIARPTDVPLVQDGLAGVAVFPGDDGPSFVSDRAYELSIHAFNDRLPITGGELQIVDPAERLREMRRSVACEAGEDGETAATVSRVLSNERGVFTFEWEASLRKGVRIWSVAIRHNIPAQVRLMFTPEGRSLSNRQLEVCRLLLDGEPIPVIAERIGVTRATLKDHTREIYRKFGVGDRNELLRKVLMAPPGPH